jgi:hypothetical protein
LRPAGRIEEAKLAFLDWFVAIQDKDEATLGSMLADEVYVKRGDRRRRREEMIAELGRHLTRLQVQSRRPEELVDLDGLTVVDVATVSGEVPADVVAPGDLVVTGRVRFRVGRSGVGRDDPRTLVVRPSGPRMLVVAIDRWPPLQ